MIVTLNELLPDARREGYAVGLFNTTDTDMLEAVISAAEAERSPVIIGTAEILLPYGELSLIAPAMVAAAERASVPVVVHYDHGLTFDRCMEALRLGFSSIMFDGSAGDPSENVATTREVTRIAHSFGALTVIPPLRRPYPLPRLRVLMRLPLPSARRTAPTRLPRCWILPVLPRSARPSTPPWFSTAAAVLPMTISRTACVRALQRSISLPTFARQAAAPCRRALPQARITSPSATARLPL